MRSLSRFSKLSEPGREGKTGKPTTAHISDRILNEAKALLQHTDWNIAGIAYALGFEYPSYFNTYFKRIIETNPKALRAREV